MRLAWKLAVALSAAIMGLTFTASPAGAGHVPAGDYRQVNSGSTWTFWTIWCTDGNALITGDVNYTMRARYNGSGSRAITMEVWKPLVGGGWYRVGGRTVTLSTGQSATFTVSNFETSHQYAWVAQYTQAGGTYWKHHPYHPGLNKAVPDPVYIGQFGTYC